MFRVKPLFPNCSDLVWTRHSMAIDQGVDGRAKFELEGLTSEL